MFLRSIILLALLLLCNCSSVPVKKQNVIPAKDYKNYITLKDEPERKTIPEKIIAIFKKEEPADQSSSPKPVKKTKMPKRRLRQTNTNSVSIEQGTLMPMDPRDAESAPKSKSNIFMYFIYIQAIIIAILSIYAYFKLRAPKTINQSNPRKLNL